MFSVTISNYFQRSSTIMSLRSKIEITALGSSTLLIKTMKLNILKPYFDLKMYAEVFKFTFYMLIF